VLVWPRGVVVGVGSVWLGGGLLRPLLWGEAVRCLGIHPLRTRRVGWWHGALRLQRFGWAQSLMSTRTEGGVMPLGELAADAVPEPCYAASLLRQRISPSRIP